MLHRPATGEGYQTTPHPLPSQPEIHFGGNRSARVMCMVPNSACKLRDGSSLEFRTALNEILSAPPPPFRAPI